MSNLWKLLSNISEFLISPTHLPRLIDFLQKESELKERNTFESTHCKNNDFTATLKTVLDTDNQQVA